MPSDTAPTPNSEGPLKETQPQTQQSIPAVPVTPEHYYTHPRQIPPFLYKIHRKYVIFARLNTYAYYLIRIISGICAVLVPFTVGSYPKIATALSITVAISIAIDMVLKPLEGMTIYSDATDQLTIEEAKLAGDYDAYQTIWEIVRATESLKRINLIELRTALDTLRNMEKR